MTTAWDASVFPLKRGSGARGVAPWGSSCCWLWWASHARLHAPRLVVLSRPRGAGVVTVTQVAIAARALSSIPVPVPRFGGRPTVPRTLRFLTLRRQWLHVRFMPPARCRSYGDYSSTPRGHAPAGGLPRQGGGGWCPMMGTQAANTRCVKTAPTNALTSRSSELFETSLCQGECIIRQVLGPVGK